jgi:hypothetical protein
LYSFGSHTFKVSLFAGPYLAFVMGGYKLPSGGEINNIKIGSGENKDLKPFDFGFNFGTGVNVKGLLVSAQYGIGLANVAPSANSEMKNKVLGISISSSFAVKEH